MDNREEDESMDYEQYLQGKADKRESNGLSSRGLNMEHYDPKGEGYVEPAGSDGMTMRERAAIRAQNKAEGLETKRRPRFVKGDSYRSWKQQGYGGTRRLRSLKTSQGGRKRKSSKRKRAKKSRSSRRRR